MMWMKIGKSLLNPDNIFMIRQDQDKIVFYGSSDTEVHMQCDDKEDAIKKLDEIFEALAK